MVSKPGRTMLVKWRSLLAALIITIIAAIAAIPSPLDRVIEMGIGHWAWRPVSGDIIVVGIDDKTMQNITSEQEILPLHASIIEKINEAGAKRVFIDYSYENRLTDPNFIELTAAVKKLGNRAILAVPSATYSGNEAIIDAWPSQEFGDQAQLACICWEYHYWQVWNIPLSVYADGKLIPSFAALLAERPFNQPKQYPIDYSYRADSIPVYSAADVIGGHIPVSALAGKDVIFAPLNSTSADRHHAPGHDLLPGAYVHVMAGETFKRAFPSEIHWSVSLAVMVVASLALIRFRKTKKFLLLTSLFFTILIVAKLTAALFLLRLVIGPAFLWLAVSAFLVARARNKLAAQHENPVSGLPNFNAMRISAAFDTHCVIAAQIVNFAQLVTYLPHESSIELVAQIARRLELATSGYQLHHDSDGNFAWLTPPTGIFDVDSQLSGLSALFNAPINIDGHKVDVKIAFGVNPESNGSNAQRLAAAIGAAEKAIKNRSLIERYSSAQGDDAGWKLSFHSQLEDAMAAGDIWVAYQPQYHIKDRNLCGIEALARWTHPLRGNIPPDQFVRQAEQTQDIYPLTLFVMERALASARELQNAGHNLSVSVNLSAVLLSHMELAPTIQHLLFTNQIDAERLTVEITETARFEDEDQALSTLSQLRKQGVRLSIDDYGTGQSNLEYLTRIDADEIKIDKHFVTTMRDSQRNFEIVKSTIELAHRLGAVAVAEGIEDRATFNLLKKLGCDVGQGYHLGKPQLFYEILASLSDPINSHHA